MTSVSKPGSQAGGHAVVIGGSMAGLLTGRVLTEHFERVTIVERDRLPDQPLPRSGAPQARHQHVLLTQGTRILEKLFPGLRDELVAAGVPVVDMAADMQWLTPYGWAVRFPSDLLMLACSRDLLEWGVRRRLAAHSRVRFREGHRVTGLEPRTDGTGVAGVRLSTSTHTADPARAACVLHADLVVDASGRASQLPQWLEALGYPAPEETVISARLGYASRIVRPRAERSTDWIGVYIQAAPPEFTRGGVALPMEGGAWLVTMVGGSGDYPPTDPTGFLEFARGMRSPLLYDILADAEPLSPVFGYRSTENRLRHYERTRRWPERLVVLGDAVCAFNPVYAQGMTTAAQAAMLLDRCLHRRSGRRRRGLDGLARRFQTALARLNAQPWTLATGEDYRYRGVEGAPPPPFTGLMHRYLDRVVKLSTERPEVRKALLEVFHMVRSPTALFHPGILLPALAVGSTRRTAAPIAGGEPVPATA